MLLWFLCLLFLVAHDCPAAKLTVARLKVNKILGGEAHPINAAETASATEVQPT
jgi:hypothetical protein